MPEPSAYGVFDHANLLPKFIRATLRSIMGNQDYLSYAKMVQLENQERVFMRFLNQGDRVGFADLVGEAGPDDLLFLKHDFQDRKTLDHWFDRLNYRQILPLVAVDLDRHRFAAVAMMLRQEHALKHIGEIRILVAAPYRDLGLGSLMLEDLIRLAWQDDLCWLAAEVPWEHPQMVSAFEARGFEIKARLEDYFRRQNGVTHDVVLMMRPMMRRRSLF
jgi:L-amino acid N-acyltransferase YncA